MTATSLLANITSKDALQQLLATFVQRRGFSTVFGLYLLWAVVKYRRSVYGMRPRPDLKGPSGYPLIGNLVEMSVLPMNQFLQYLHKNHLRYGPVFSFALPGFARIIHVNDPESVDHVLRANFWAYEKGPLAKKMVYPLAGEGIFGADGEHWKWQRKLASHIFNVKAFRQYTTDVFTQEAKTVIDYLSTLADTGKPVDLLAVFYHYTMDSFGEIAFGESLGGLKNPEQKSEFAVAFDRLNHNLSNRILTPTRRLMDRLRGVDAQVAADSKCAGRDTTAQALSWTFYLLHRSQSNPDVIKRLREEGDTILHGGSPTYEDTKKQKYAEACFYEALRMYPVVPKATRGCVQDDVLPNGIKVYKGERVGWSSWVMGRTKEIWGPDAEEFKPDRWINEERPSSSKFIAFHHGPRICLGQQFATIEAITLMSMLLQEFTFELVDPHSEPVYLPSLTLPMEHGLKARVKRRV
ncbi:hypothetical protein BGW38_004960 [Lunasporangiospora selenospora]|uniref:Cytochrome P450 n=1 Tax=Lunasporangiospora selenospora TaxID=979761 RepID=A0A9P6KGM7_9FUNG|nr:hypothetical protein BGW38_004960 [Lunasporangiospora selenospora]